MLHQCIFQVVKSREEENLIMGYKGMGWGFHSCQLILIQIDVGFETPVQLLIILGLNKLCCLAAIVTAEKNYYF